MIKDSLIQQAFEVATERYAVVGTNVREALEDMEKISLSLHCWQADGVSNFENQGGSLIDGVQATGDYPGCARTIDELRRDVLKVKSYISGNRRFSLHEIYGDFQGEKADRGGVEPHHLESWIQWVKEDDSKLGFNSTSFSHSKSEDLTLVNPSDGVRNFRIEHTECCRWTSDEMGKVQNDSCMMSLWIHDRSKEVPASCLHYCRILEESLGGIFATEYKWMKDCIEAKLLGIGLESCMVDSYDFRLNYGVKKNKIATLDIDHFHPTESIADKVSSLLLFTPEIMLHVSRPTRRDSDHIVILNDGVQDSAREIVRCDALDQIHIGLDYFGATVDRIGAYVIGSRAMQKAFTLILLEPIALLYQYKDEGKYFQHLALQEEAESLSWGAI